MRSTGTRVKPSVAGCACVAVLMLAACGGRPRLEYPPEPAPVHAPEGSIVVLGDTQRTSAAEVRIYHREQNDRARVALIEKLDREERPAFIVHLGDLVTVGGLPESWERYDELVSPLTKRGIPILPVLGNHDYWGDRREAMRQAVTRFPQLRDATFYSMRHHELGLVWLNSNLRGGVGSEQAAWFEETLDAFDEDERIRAVLVFTHHPPYTNGRHRAGDPYVRSEILPAFYASKKAVVLLSGHVHGYERFTAKRKAFVVSGGGGGPRVEYRVGARAVYAPTYDPKPRSGQRRAFNYVVIERAPDALRFTVKCLDIDAACDKGVLETFSIDLVAP